MHVIKSLANFLKRIQKGEDVVLVPQDASKWDKQFQSGAWGHLMSDHPNTNLLAGMVLHMASSSTKPLSILDCGCGNGALAALLKDEIKSGTLRYMGTDISAVAIEQARSRVPEANFQTLSVDTPPPDIAAADILVFNEVLYYVNPNEILSVYAKETRDTAKVAISIIHTWRSLFLWNRIQKHVHIERKFSVRDHNKGQRFDVVVASFKKGLD